VESLASGHVDAFCVGAPWNSVAVDLGVGSILHFGCEIMTRASEKALALRESWADENPDALVALIRAMARASEFAIRADNRTSVAHIVAQRVGISHELVVRTLTGNLKTMPDGKTRKSDRYIVIGGDDANRPDPVQAAWAYAQIVRWGQAPLSDELRVRAERVFRADLYDGALGLAPSPAQGGNIGAFVGPEFDPSNLDGYLSAWRSRRPQQPRLTIVR
jgi:two-component system, oxyanion-binding sensor